MGYSYHLQFDDDAMLNSALAYNVVDKLKERNYLMVRELVASIDQHVLRAPTVTWCRITTYLLYCRECSATSSGKYRKPP